MHYITTNYGFSFLSTRLIFQYEGDGECDIESIPKDERTEERLLEELQECDERRDSLREQIETVQENERLLREMLEEVRKREKKGREEDSSKYNEDEVWARIINYCVSSGDEADTINNHLDHKRYVEAAEYLSEPGIVNVFLQGQKLAIALGELLFIKGEFDSAYKLIELAFSSGSYPDEEFFERIIELTLKLSEKGHTESYKLFKKRFTSDGTDEKFRERFRVLRRPRN